MQDNDMTSSHEEVQDSVRQEYTRCASQSWHIAEYLYTPEELALLPQKAIQIALGLGNPVREAHVQPGETVLDLGCGGGIDTLLSAQYVGPQGSATGLDMTPAMVETARLNAATLGLKNAHFVEGTIEALPFPDESVDVVLSNGVFNLAPNKDIVFAEARRVLRPHGRLVVADMLLRGDLPASIRDDPKLWSG
jgi:arsenite methyltransferase